MGFHMGGVQIAKGHQPFRFIAPLSPNNVQESETNLVLNKRYNSSLQIRSNRLFEAEREVIHFEQSRE